MNCSSPTFPELELEPVAIGRLHHLSRNGCIAFSAMVAVLSIYAIISNGFVMYAVSWYLPLRCRNSNLWLSSLAATDIFVALLVTPVAAFYNSYGAWTLGSAGCKVRNGRIQFENHIINIQCHI